MVPENDRIGLGAHFRDGRIYARKATEQLGVADEQKSVARQVEHARADVTAKGLTVDNALVFVDDGISGAEFDRRRAFLRLMNALRPSRGAKW